MNIPDNPFSLIVCAPFSPDTDSGAALDQPLPVGSAGEGLFRLAPSLYIPLPLTLSPDGGIQLTFTRLEDFAPETIVARTPWLKALAQTGEQERTVTGKAARQDPLDALLAMVELPPENTGPQTTDQALHTEADAIIAGVLTRIFSDHGFQRMEAAWRGVALLFAHCPNGRFSLSLISFAGYTTSELPERVIRSLDSEPPDLLLFDAAFDATPPGMLLLETLSTLAERLVCPLICWCGPTFFHADGWDGLVSLPYLPHHLDGFSYARWKTLRSRSAARWTVATCNRLMLRPPHCCDAQAGFFREGSGLMASPVWGLAALMLYPGTQGYNLSTAVTRNMQAGFSADHRLAATETELPHERQQQLLASGITPLVADRHGMVGIPGLVAIDGCSIATASALSWTIHALIRMRKKYGPAEDGEALAHKLQDVFSGQMNHRSVAGISGLQVGHAHVTCNGEHVLAVTIMTGAMERGDSIEFTFTW